MDYSSRSRKEMRNQILALILFHCLASADVEQRSLYTPIHVTIINSEPTAEVPEGIRVIRDLNLSQKILFDTDYISVFEATNKLELTRLDSHRTFSIRRPKEGTSVFWQIPNFISREDRKTFLSQIMLRRGEILVIPEVGGK